jgi:hypothetical protein
MEIKTQIKIGFSVFTSDQTEEKTWIRETWISKIMLILSRNKKNETA